MTIRPGRLDLSPSNRVPIVSDGSVAVHTTSLLNPDPARQLTPNAFLVDQPAGAVIRTHFHTTSQWQVFVGGSGTLGRRPVQGFVVQYVAAHTGYGPITAGEQGLWYMTLRASGVMGAKYLPDSRASLDTSLPKVQHISECFLPDAVDAGLPVTEMIAPRWDGVAAWMVHVPPGQTVSAPRHQGGIARYYVIASGEMVAKDCHLGPLSIVWTDEDDLSMPLQAGQPGLTVMVLQFPLNAT